MIDCPSCRRRRDEYPGFERVEVNSELRWREPYRTVVPLTFDFQGSEGLAPEANGEVRSEMYHEREYGPKTGIWRVLRVLERHDVTATFLITGAIAENYPQSVRAIQEAGHEIAGHGYHHEVAAHLAIEEEREVMSNTMAVLKDITGQTINGWRNCHESDNTKGLVLEFGMGWNSGASQSSEHPFLLTQGDKTLVEIPRDSYADLRPQDKSPRPAMADALSTWTASFDTIYDESALWPTMAPYTFHPFNIGRPSGGAVLSELIGHIKKHPDAYFATMSEVETHTRNAARELGLLTGEKSTVPVGHST